MPKYAKNWQQKPFDYLFWS